MQFIQASTESGIQRLTIRLASLIQEGKRVLWLTSGGSNIPLIVEVMAALPDDLTAELTIMPVDERYGPPGHVNSNVQQLLEANFQPKLAHFIPVLRGDDLDTTRMQYNAEVAEAMEGRVVIAQLGMGADGHIAGILPGSPACAVHDRLVTAYEGPDFTRITLTFPALRHIDEAYLFAYGNGKREALTHLRDEDLPFDDQPAQILKDLPSTYVYNDQVEGE